tara:strand:+ start:76 stop:576 length:501 start_codon:yes stop_codon:yes gene_type:complete
MFYNLPIEINLLINSYYSDFICIKNKILLGKIYKIKQNIQEDIDNLCYLNESIYRFKKNKIINKLKNNEIIGNNINNYINKIEKVLTIPKNIVLFECIKKIERNWYETIEKVCKQNINKFCNHTLLNMECDDDYHKPRYEFYCLFCQKEVYRMNFPKDYKILQYRY